MKKNEQGMYQRRYVCIVPHTFMYYFDSDTSEAPRGKQYINHRHLVSPLIFAMRGKV